MSVTLHTVFLHYSLALSLSLSQIDSTGGPLPHTAIDYSISNVTVATVDPAGLVTAVTPGTTVVTGQSHDLLIQSHDLLL